MKRLLGIILLTTTCSILSVEQEKLTGEALKKAYEEAIRAQSSFWRREVSLATSDSYMNAYERILGLLDEEGMTVAKVKEYLQKESDKREKEYNRAKDKYEKVKKELDIAEKQANKLIDAAAKKIG